MTLIVVILIEAINLPLDVFYAHKNPVFFIFLVTFCSLVSFLCFLFAQNLFVKKIKMFEIVLIGSINITTESKLLLKKCVVLNKLKTISSRQSRLV